MKKLFVMIALAATTAVQAGEVNDSIVVSNPQTVTIVKNDSLQKVNIIGMQGDSDFRYTSEVPIDQKKMKQQKVKDALETETGKWVLDLGVGCNIASNNKADFGFAPFKSKEIFCCRSASAGSGWGMLLIIPSKLLSFCSTASSTARRAAL